MSQGGGYEDGEHIEMAQRTKCSWLHDGDRCTRLFYDVVRARHHRNHINKLIDDEGREAAAPEAICEVAVRYYAALYNQNSYLQVFPEIICKRVVSAAGNRVLLARSPPRRWKISSRTRIRIKRQAQTGLVANSIRSIGTSSNPKWWQWFQTFFRRAD